ncbi:uncharacterized protein LOC119607159 [Lucilia sericata]|uniref:uncharacterized protein LOC119607159 n=1 Tax=Lucilia sericata TaxID=13632 RepID=UPI0018A831B2|nr:uncharacterized protein LOC119607159 [Lucilia sericata]
MKFWLLISLISVCIVANRAAVARGTYKDPRYPGKCVVGDLIVSPGEEATHPFSRCGRMLCGSEGSVVFHTCGAIGAPSGYKLGDPIEPTAPYPTCCKRHFIPIDN